MHDFHADEWLVQPALCRLSKDGRTVQVRAKVMDVLEYLAARPGEVVRKETLLDDVWGAREISESALTRTVTELRHALGDEVAKPRFLETIPKRGYRFIATVTPAATVRPHLPTQIERVAIDPPLQPEVASLPDTSTARSRSRAGFVVSQMGDMNGWLPSPRAPW